MRSSKSAGELTAGTPKLGRESFLVLRQRLLHVAVLEGLLQVDLRRLDRWIERGQELERVLRAFLREEAVWGNRGFEFAFGGVRLRPFAWQAGRCHGGA